MKFVSEPTMNCFRGIGRCEYCGQACRRLEPHHLFRRGQGAANRLDVRCNLIALGSAMDCGCHARQEAGNIPRADLVALVSARELLAFGERELEAVVWLIRRAPKTADHAWFVWESTDMNCYQQALLDRSLEEMGLFAGPK